MCASMLMGRMFCSNAAAGAGGQGGLVESRQAAAMGAAAAVAAASPRGCRTRYGAVCCCVVGVSSMVGSAKSRCLGRRGLAGWACEVS